MWVGKVQGNMFSNYEALWEDGRLEAVFEENKKNEWGRWVTLPSWTPQLPGKHLVYAPVSAHERAWTLNNPVIATDIDDPTDHQSHTQLMTCWSQCLPGNCFYDVHWELQREDYAAENQT